MKQVLQQLGSGETHLLDVPTPAISANEVLIRSSKSLISVGTEKMLLEFGRASYLKKARQQPEKVRQVLEKMQTDGVLPTIEAVRGKLETAIPLGYSNVGVVMAAGKDVTEFKVGDRVVSNGNHAEEVAVSKNLCAIIPDNVTDEDATFTVLGSIALQGVRLAAPTLGETFVVIGLGLLGLLSAQLLRANGCRVIVYDLDAKRMEHAAKQGFETVGLSGDDDPVITAIASTDGTGVDGVIITAATQSDEPVRQAAKMCRKRGRIVLVGVTGLNLDRSLFYEKELTFQVSCSYGPGRYDSSYEEHGNDYPIGFVRWTVQRNFQAILALLSNGNLTVADFISHRFPIDDVASAYDLVASPNVPSLGIVLQYEDNEAGEQPKPKRKISLSPAKGEARNNGSPVSIAMVGAGNYASRTLVPAFLAAKAKLDTVVSRGGVTATNLGRKAGFDHASTDVDDVIASDGNNTIVIATQHNTHAQLVQDALKFAKHVFVEKPLGITHEEVSRIEEAWHQNQASAGSLLMIGFNRRFSPLVVEMKRLVERSKAPKTIICTINAGDIPVSHWTQDPAIGGGRLIGEGCHFIDLMRHLVGAPIVDWQVMTVSSDNGSDTDDDKATVTLTFEDGSLGTLHYFANGHRSFPKERIDVFVDGKSLHIDNFISLVGYGWPGFKKKKLWSQDKGQVACAEAFVSAINNGKQSPIPADEIFEVARVSIDIGEKARK